MFRTILTDPSVDDSFKSYLLSPPSVSVLLSSRYVVVDSDDDDDEERDDYDEDYNKGRGSGIFVVPVAVHLSRKATVQLLAYAFGDEIRDEYNCLSRIVIVREGKDEENGDTKITAAATTTTTARTRTDALSRASRSLRNFFLEYMCQREETKQDRENSASVASRHYNTARCLTDRLILFRILCHTSGSKPYVTRVRENTVRRFYDVAKGGETPS